MADTDCWHDTTPGFTDRDLQLIVDTLPSGANPRRREILPNLLRDWAAHDLPWHFVKDDGPAEKDLKAVTKHGQGLLKALSSLDENARIELARAVGLARGQSLLGGISADEYFTAAQAFLTELGIAAAAATVRKPRGRPRADTELRVIRDIASIFEWVTGGPAGRGVSRVTGEEAGPFRRFAEAIWPPIFGRGDDGLYTAMRKAVVRRALAAQEDLPEARPSLISEGDADAGAALLGLPPGIYDLPFVIRIIAARHPEWQIFEL